MYNYEEQREWLFTDEGQRDFLKVRDRAKKLLAEAGAFTMFGACKRMTGDNWHHLACVDRLVELGEIREITAGMDMATQNRVFVETVT